MKRLTFFVIAALIYAPFSFAGWLSGYITEIEISTDTQPKLVVVQTDFQTSCPNVKAFELLETDPYFKETYSLMLLVFVSNSRIEYFEVYCDTATNLSRGNRYKITK